MASHLHPLSSPHSAVLFYLLLAPGALVASLSSPAVLLLSFSMSSGSVHPRPRWYHGSRARRNFPRIDAVLIGPGGEIVAAHGAGTNMPALPIVETGRLAQYPDDGTNAFIPMAVTGDVQGMATQVGCPSVSPLACLMTSLAD